MRNTRKPSSPVARAQRAATLALFVAGGACFFGDGLTAQAPLQSLRVDDVAGVYAGNSWQGSTRNIAIGSSLELAQDFQRGSQVVASARSLATKTLAGFHLRVEAQAAGRGASSGTTTGSGGLPGAQSYRLGLRAQSAQTATVVLRYRGTVQGAASGSASLYTNVGNHTLIPDGTTRKWVQTGFPIHALENVLTLHVDAQCGAASVASVTWDIEVEIEAQTRCSVSYGSPSCTAAGTLAGYVRGLGQNQDTILSFETRTPAVTPPTLATLLVSSTGQTIGKLQGFASPSCTMFTITPILVDIQAAPFGQVRHTVTIPPSLTGSIYFQTLLAHTGTIPHVLATTNTMRVDCR